MLNGDATELKWIGYNVKFPLFFCADENKKIVMILGKTEV